MLIGDRGRELLVIVQEGWSWNVEEYDGAIELMG
jgi:hypothetical protein